MKKAEIARGRESLLRTFSSVTLVIGVVGCSQELVIGDEKGLPESRAELLKVPPWSPLAAYEGSGECAAMDEVVRAPYEEWRRERNEMGVLVGTNWHGTLQSGKALRLFIEPDTTASIIFGDVAQPLPAVEADKGYLCGWDPDSLNPTLGVDCEVNSDGAPFEIHGANFEEGELVLPVYGNAPWQEWCALQEPVEWERGSCEFFAFENVAVGIDPVDRNLCSTYVGEAFENPVLVDCSWVKMIRFQMDFCSCASDGCFAKNQSPRDRFLRLLLSEDGDTLTGEIQNQFGDAQSVMLLRVP
jgi:hypothetical protein